MFNKPFEEIDKSDIEALIRDEVPEGKELEYKRELPGQTEKEKMEFLSDVCSVANASGGHIIYGMSDKKDAKGKNTGIPEYAGLGKINADEQKLRLEHIILNGIDPRIPGIQMRLIEGFDNGPVMLIKTPQSWASPHMVKRNSRFYSRTSSGKYPLDVHEIRAAFALSEALPEQIRRFRADRLAKIVAGETPIQLNDGAKIILHIIPVCAFDQRKVYDLSTIERNPTELPPIWASGWSHRYNFDGLLTYDQPRSEPTAYSYVQLFRNGIIEALDISIIQAGGESKSLSRGYEEDLLRAVKTYLGVQKKLGVETPVYVMLSLLGVCGYTIGGCSSVYSRRGQHPIDRDTLIIQEVIVEAFDCELADIMRPAFYTVWNASGWPRSMNYDERDKWVGQ